MQDHDCWRITAEELRKFYDAHRVCNAIPVDGWREIPPFIAWLNGEASSERWMDGNLLKKSWGSGPGRSGRTNGPMMRGICAVDIFCSLGAAAIILVLWLPETDARLIHFT